MKHFIVLILFLAQSAFANNSPDPCDDLLGKPRTVALDLAEEIARNFPHEPIAPVLNLSAAKFTIADLNEIQKIFRELNARVTLVDTKEDRDKTEVEIEIFGHGLAVSGGLKRVQTLVDNHRFGRTFRIEDRWNRPIEYTDMDESILYTRFDEVDDLSVRTVNALHAEHIDYIGQLIQLENVVALYRIPGLGAKSRLELEDFLQSRNLQLNTKVKNWNPPSKG